MSLGKRLTERSNAALVKRQRCESESIAKKFDRLREAFSVIVDPRGEFHTRILEELDAVADQSSFELANIFSFAVDRVANASLWPIRRGDCLYESMDAYAPQDRDFVSIVREVFNASPSKMLIDQTSYAQVMAENFDKVVHDVLETAFPGVTFDVHFRQADSILVSTALDAIVISAEWARQ